MFLYYYFQPDSKKDDDFYNDNDDCALCRAWTKKQAIKKFHAMYDNVNDNNVSRVRFNSYGVAILSDY